MWTVIRREVEGRMRAIRSRWKPNPIQVEQLTIHRPDRASRLGDWIARAGRMGVPYRPSWLRIEQQIESLFADQPARLTQSQADRFMGGVDSFEFVHVNHRGGRFLSSLVAQFDHPTVLEIGTAFGVSGMYLLSEIDRGHLWTFDPCDDWKEVSQCNLSAVSAFYHRIPEAFEIGFPSRRTNIEPIDIAFVDGLHTYDNVMQEVELLQDSMADSSVLVLHDVELDDEMKRAWTAVKSNPRVGWSAFVERQFGICELLPVDDR